MLIAWGWIVAIGLAVNGLSYFVGRFIAAPAMICFVFLSMPSSGGAYPKWFMPEPFAWLNNVVVGSSMVDMIKHQVYGVGPGPARGLITMACYATAGLVLMYFGKKWWERRRIRAIVTGRTTMFQDANTANREFLGKQRDAELERHGLTSTETGTLQRPARRRLGGRPHRRRRLHRRSRRPRDRDHCHRTHPVVQTDRHGGAAGRTPRSGPTHRPSPRTSPRPAEPGAAHGQHADR